MTQNFRRVLLMLIILIVFFVLSFIGLGRKFQGLSQPWLKPIIQLTATIGGRFNQLWQTGQLASDNELLRHEVAELVARQSSADTLRQENSELRQLIALPNVVNYDRLAVEIIGQQVDETGISYLINRGSNDGLEPGLAAVAGLADINADTTELVIVGTIKNVGKSISTLSLITSGNSKILSKIAQGAAGQSLAVGEYNLAVRLKYLSIDENIKIGDAIVTSSLNRLIPAGILLGTVTAIDKKPGELFQSAVVAPPVPPEQFRFLYILKPILPQ